MSDFSLSYKQTIDKIEHNLKSINKSLNVACKFV